MQLGLVDEYRLYVHPIILGSGKLMLPHTYDKCNLKLIDTHAFGSGVVLLRLANKGAALPGAQPATRTADALGD